MDFYVISPTAHLELMNQGDRFFCLAQLYTQQQNEDYRNFFKQKVKEGAWVTLDNGAGDHNIVTPRALLAAMIDLEPSEIIPPDFLFKGAKTIRSLESFIYAAKSYRRIMKNDSIQFLGCPQGKDVNEWMFVYKYMLEHPDVSTIGLSKIAVPKAFLNADNDQSIAQGRQFCIDILFGKNLLNEEKPIHFLGMGDPREFQYYKQFPSKLFRSTDSCNTVWSAMNNIVFEEGNFQRVPTPKDYFDKKIDSEDTYRKVLSNIEWFRNELTK